MVVNSYRVLYSMGNRESDLRRFIGVSIDVPTCIFAETAEQALEYFEKRVHNLNQVKSVEIISVDNPDDKLFKIYPSIGEK